MDNVTHSLVGVLMGRAWPLKQFPSRHAMRTALVATAVLGNNIPDADVLLRPLFGGDQLFSLLHHRGYTHTVLAAPLLGAIAALIAFIFVNRGSKSDSSALSVSWCEFPILWLLGALSVCAHILADSANNYGVHPWAPFNNNWYYGDSIFILEPLIWVVLLPWLMRRSMWRWGRRLATFLLIVLNVLSWCVAGVPPAISTAVLVLSAFFIFIHKRIDGWRQGLFVATSFFGVISCFVFASQRARALALDTLNQFNPRETQVDLALFPAPGNPFCWHVLSLRWNQEYVARSGALSFWPELFDPSRCLLRVEGQKTTAILELSDLPVQKNFFWFGRYRLSEQELGRILNQDCRFRAFLRFARIPFIGAWQSTPIAGDLRYDREEGIGFAEIPLESNGSQDCPQWKRLWFSLGVPPWQTPLWQHLIQEKRIPE